MVAMVAMEPMKVVGSSMFSLPNTFPPGLGDDRSMPTELFQQGPPPGLGDRQMPAELSLHGLLEMDSSTSPVNSDIHRRRQLELENKLLSDESVRLITMKLELENARLAQEVVALRSLSMQSGAWGHGSTLAGPPGMFLPHKTKPVRSESECSTVASSRGRRLSADPSTGDLSALSSPSFTDSSDEDSGETTIMMRNIPNNYTRDMLVRTLDVHGFAGAYDMVYLPLDFTSGAGLGYAFLNFVSVCDAQRFKRKFQGFRDWEVPSEKVCSVQNKASVQGLRANIERYRNNPMMHESVPDAFKPVLFSNGMRVAFPPPTRRLRAPSTNEAAKAS